MDALNAEGLEGFMKISVALVQEFAQESLSHILPILPNPEFRIVTLI